MIETIVAGRLEENTYVISSKNGDAFVIDPGDNLDEHFDKLKKYNIKFVLITHGHYDHTSGLKLFKCPIYVYKDEMPFFYDSRLNLAPRNKDLGFSDLDIHYYGDDQTFNFNGEMIKFIKTPGHTIGSVCYIYKDNIFTGDTLFRMSYGRTDFPTGSNKQMKESIYNLLQTYPENYKVYPGHDSSTTIGAEKKSNPLYLHIIQSK